MLEKHNRKIIRLQNYDYSSNGAYFITICTHQKKNLFGPVGMESISAWMIRKVFEETIAEHSAVSCPQYVVMPNHFHALIVIERKDKETAPTIMQIVQSFKRKSTIRYIEMVKQGLVPPYDEHIWQRSFYDHVVRNREDFLDIWKYIEENPIKWEQDRFYIY